MTYTQFRLRNGLVRGLVVLGMTAIVLLLSAILLPPKGSNAMPRGADAPTVPLQ